MNINELLQNPLILGLIAAIGTYAYLYYDNKQKQKQFPKSKIEEIGFITPMIVGLLVFVIAHNLFKPNLAEIIDHTPKAQCNELIANNIIKDINMDAFNHKGNINVDPKGYINADTATYHTVGKNAIRLPSNADVFIDLGKF